MKSPESDKKVIRFSDKEKAVLYTLFQKYKELIDIKQRKSSQHKMSEVRECWQIIHSEYNNHPETRERLLKQIQKFWLNARLRKSINSSELPERGSGNNDHKIKRYKYEIPSHSDNDSDQQSKGDDDQCSNSRLEEFDNDNIVVHTTVNNSSKTNNHFQNLKKEKYDNVEIETVNIRNFMENPLANIDIKKLGTKPQQHTYSQEISRTKQATINDKYQLSSESTSRRTSIREDSNQQISNEIVEKEIEQPIEETIEHYETTVTYDNRIKELQLQEMQNRVKLSQLKCEQQQVELTKVREELEHMKNMNRLQEREIDMKISLLEQEKKRRR